jgi:hypothetical protein
MTLLLFIRPFPVRAVVFLEYEFQKAVLDGAQRLGSKK